MSFSQKRWNQTADLIDMIAYFNVPRRHDEIVNGNSLALGCDQVRKPNACWRGTKALNSFLRKTHFKTTLPPVLMKIDLLRSDIEGIWNFSR
jgi:hypothetical protein